MLGLFDWLITEKKQKKKGTNLFTPKIDKLFVFPFDLLNFFYHLAGGSRWGVGGPAVSVTNSLLNIYFMFWSTYTFFIKKLPKIITILPTL
jgi:hypothetical protein